jgi:GT2 family glycosyltransferase
MKRAGESSLLVSLVTHNDESYIARCLQALADQSLEARVKVLDNASGDGSVAVAERHGATVERSPRNLGYCGGHNWNLRGEDFEYALLLNADVILSEGYAETLVRRLIDLPQVGLAGGKLRRIDRSGNLVGGERGPLLDSTGIYFTPSMRHFDRGSNRPDTGQYDRAEFVFGITGAALLCRREFIDDIRVEGEFLDEDFFAYREDADLAWRAQLRGWKALYEPGATGGHIRQVFPRGRRQMNPVVNYHSVKNRFLMRRKNMDSAVARRCFPYMWLRDLAILGYVHTRERSSLAALREVECLTPRTEGKRLRIQSSRRVPPAEIAPWFAFTPRALPIPRQQGDNQRRFKE